jgi:2-polyprenyl-3-methyl-5-hydroxy-6-metoxy-1,4-benzoquinol methylase
VLGWRLCRGMRGMSVCDVCCGMGLLVYREYTKIVGVESGDLGEEVIYKRRICQVITRMSITNTNRCTLHLIFIRPATR